MYFMSFRERLATEAKTPGAITLRCAQASRWRPILQLVSFFATNLRQSLMAKLYSVF
jgi:hypothetical protein